MNNYEDRIVLFLDILGFKRIIDGTMSKEEEEIPDKTQFIIETINEMAKTVELTTEGTSKNVTQFSDSIVISFKQNDIREIPKLFYNLLRLITNLLSREILCRGAVSYGKLYHKDNLIFGPALVDAYEAESQIALYPRVILDKSVIEIMKYHYTSENDNFFRRIRFDTEIESYLKTDTDDKFYIDYFFGSMIFLQNEELFRVYNNLRKLIVDGLRFKDTNFYIKYEWMKSKYNKLPKILKRIDKEGELFVERKDIEQFVKDFKPIKTTTNTHS